MYLKSIELLGFKSFAKKSVLKFNARVSSIVGPNGSGKSNVAEAFRFVLGEQSIKSLRGKRGEDLIFNGGGGEARSNRASVKVTFDNSSKLFSLDFPEISIERVVHRDGVNDYFINGSPTRLKDILELLASAHIGASGHQIISQGEADKILNASSRERKSIIEDALGLKVYQYKRIESERKLKKTFENIAQVESLRREIAPHLRFLKKQVEKMEKAENLKREIIELAKDYFRRENSYISSGKAAIEKERRPIDESLEKLGSELKSAKEILEKSGKEKNKEYAILELESELAALRAERDALNRNLGKVEGQISSEERILKRERELGDLSNKTVRYQEVEGFTREILLDIEKAETDDSDIRQALIKLKDRVKSFILSLTAEESGRAADAESALKSYLVEKEKLEASIKESDERERKLNDKYESLKKEIEKEKDSSRDAEKAVFRLMAEERDLRSKLEMLRLREERLHLEEAEYKRDLSEVGVLTGTEALHFNTEESDANEDRRMQEERKHLLEKLKIRLEEAGLAGSDEVMKEYKETSERDQFFERELGDLEKSAVSLRELIKSLEERLSTEFASGLEKINREFGELFTTMFGGGSAHLTLSKEKKPKIEAALAGEEVDEDEEDEIIEEGLEIAVSLPRKKIKGLMMLSGGERALTSIALLFAISLVNPPPFIVLDETDAALDEANSKKYGDLVEKLSQHSQLILITHNRETMSRAGVIYGVTMSSTGVSKLLSISFDEAVEVAK